MMHDRNHKNITTLLESIEGLHALATDAESQKIGSTRVNNNDVVKLKTAFSSRADKDENSFYNPFVSEKKGSEAMHDEDDFDSKLTKLIRDVVENEPQAVSRHRTTPHSKLETSDDRRKTPYLEASSAENSRDIRSEIDNLLAPYLDKTIARSTQNSSQQASRRPVQNHIQNSEKESSYKLFQKEVTKKTNGQTAEDFLQTTTGGKNIRALLTNEDLEELNLFIKQEIKKQISVWIEQNIDQIVEDSLLSDRPDARNASRVTRTMTKDSG